MMQERGLTGDYVRNHAIPEEFSYEELRETINGLIREAADWLDAQSERPVKLRVATLSISAKPPCCIDLEFATEFGSTIVRGTHIPCLSTEFDMEY